MTKAAFNKFYVELASHEQGKQLNAYLQKAVAAQKLKPFLQEIYNGNAPFIKVIKIGFGLLAGKVGEGKLQLENAIARENADILYSTETGRIYSFPVDIPHDVSFLNTLSSFLDAGDKLSDVDDEFLNELNLEHSAVRCLAACSELEKQAPYMFNKLAELTVQLMSYYNVGFYNITEDYLKNELQTEDLPTLKLTNKTLDFGWLVSHYAIEYPDKKMDTHTSCIEKIFANTKEIVDSDEFRKECERFNEIADRYLTKVTTRAEELLGN